MDVDHHEGLYFSCLLVGEVEEGERERGLALRLVEEVGGTWKRWGRQAQSV